MITTVEFMVSGDFAMFADPITRVGGEKFSYDIPTYEALRGVLESIYWKPTFNWIIDKVRVMKPIRRICKSASPMQFPTVGTRTLSYYTYLKDCCYQVQAHFEWNMNLPQYANDRDYVKHRTIAQRMIDKGGRFDVFLGARECQAYVEPCKFGEGEGFYDKEPARVFGVMYHGLTYPEEAYSEETRHCLTRNMWSPIMRQGVINFIKPCDCPIHEKVKDYSYANTTNRKPKKERKKNGAVSETN